MQEESGGIKKIFFLYLGHLCVALGFIGIAVPLMPATVFFICAAYCYARSSKKFYNWLMEHPLFGIHIKNFQAGKITRKGKIISITAMSSAIIISIILITPPIWVIALLVACIIGVSAYILSFKTV